MDNKESLELETGTKLSLLQELEAAAEELLRKPDCVQSTRKIETALEAQKKKTINRREFLQGMGIIGIASALGITAILPKKETAPQLPKRFAREAKKVKPEVFREILGFDPKKYGFEPVMQIDQEDKRFIIHIGQLHPSESPLGVIRAKEISQNQKNIEQVLREGQFETIFVEGVSPEVKEILEAFRLIKEKMFDPIAPQPTAWQQLVDNYFQVKEIAEKRQCQTCQTILDYIVLNKIKALENDFQNNPLEIKPEEREAFASAYEMTKSIEILASSYQGRESEAVLEAPLRMFIDHQIEEICPAEIFKENQEATAALNKYEEIVQRIGILADEKGLSLSAKEIAKAENNFTKQAMDDREKVAIDFVTQHPSFATGKNFALVYGAVHDFSKVVSQFNQENPSQTVGLIYLAPTVLFN